MVGEPHEEAEVDFHIRRQLRDPIEAPHTVPNVDMHSRHPTTHTAPKYDGATALRDQHIAEYKTRLQNSRARPSAAYDAVCRDMEPVATMGA